MRKKTSDCVSGCLKIWFVAALITIGLGMLGIFALSLTPSIGANGADGLRKILGDRPVAWMETVLFQAEDLAKSAGYQLGLLKARDPFVQADPPGGGAAPTQAARLNPTPLALEPPENAHLPTLPAAQDLSASEETSPYKVGEQAVSGWTPPLILQAGEEAGSGEWQPYLTDPAGYTVAYRAFVQPDLKRPYAYTAIVAFHLEKVRLNYVVGFEDPYAPGVKKFSDGMIPPNDRKPGFLLAAFNGGFKYQHGHFGSMSHGQVSVPPKEGLGTLAIFRDGTIKMGVWGQQIIDSPDLVAFRQDGPMVIQEGATNQLVDNPKYWGYTLSGDTVTWRSGLALSAGGDILYYFAGPSLSIQTLAKAMESVHPRSAIQLDINNYWVHFVAIRAQEDHMSTEALVPQAMSDNRDRYLLGYPRDFFYVTAAP